MSRPTTARTYAELFAGVSGMGMGFDRAGMKCRWRVEWDKAAAGVLAHHAPKTPLYSDVVAFSAWLRRQRLTLSKTAYEKLIRRLRTDLIGGGSPCQDLSVAGLRAGLDGSRSGLFRVMVRICRILRPRYVVWENVLGALSSNAGKDFAAVIGAWTGCIPEVPDDGWGAGGFARAAEPGRWNVAWRVFDSQYLGVPQRRRRVFLVASLGDGSCVEILFEPESVRGDHPPSRSAGEKPAGTLTGSALNGGSPCGGDGRDGLLVAGTLSSRSTGGGGLGTDMELSGGVVVAPAVVGTLNPGAHPGGYNGQDAYNDLLIAHTLRGEGFDASEDGTGRGTPLVTVPTLTSNGDAHSGFRDEHGLVLSAFAQNQSGEVRESQVMGTLGTNANASGRATPMVAAFQSSQSGVREGDVHATLDSNNGSRRHNGAITQSGVRRLTPRECERLQGWPDDHTRYARRVKLINNVWRIVGDTLIEQADGPRYKQAGNGVTSNVAEWIAKRIRRFSK